MVVHKQDDLFLHESICILYIIYIETKKCMRNVLFGLCKIEFL